MFGSVATDTGGMNSNSNCTSVFVVDDSPLIRERLVDMLTAVEGVSVVGQAESPIEAIEGIIRTNPDFVVLDIHLRFGSGFDVLKGVRFREIGATFIVLTNFPNLLYRTAYLAAGVDYFLDKSAEFDKLVEIISSRTTKNHDGRIASSGREMS